MFVIENLEPTEKENNLAIKIKAKKKKDKNHLIFLLVL